MPPLFYEQLTIFKDDTHTIDGVLIAGASSAITALQATCSTDPAHARPFLMPTLEGVNRETNMAEGKAAIGQLNFRIQDNRRLASQDTGWFTQLLADVNGKNQLVGQRIVSQKYNPWKGLYVAYDGLMDDFILGETKTYYTITTRDMMERARTLRLFYRAESSVIWPYDNVQANGVMGPGVAGGYGRFNPNDPASPLLIPDSKGVKATYHQNIYDVNALQGVIEFDERPKVHHELGNDQWSEMFGQYSVLSNDAALKGTHVTALGSMLSGEYATGVTVQWRAWNTADVWKTLRYMPHWLIKNAAGAIITDPRGRAFPTGSFTPWETLNQGRELIVTVGGISVSALTAPELPADNQQVAVRVLSGMPPSERAPMHLEMPFGTFLKNAYDGIYSSTPNDIRYSGIDESGPLLRAIITEFVDDGREWLAENWYKPLGMFPRINENGEIVPTRWSLPDAGVVLPLLTQANVKVDVSGWKHTSNDAINKVSFTYKRDFVGVDKKLHSIDVVMDEIDAPGVTRVGDRPITYHPVTIRDVSPSTDGNYGQAFKSAELGAQLFLERVNDTLDRWSLGGQHIPVIGIKSDAVVRDLKEGDWLQLQNPGLPDYATGLRGMNRVCQVVGLKDSNPVDLAIELVDGGPYAVPLATPNITGVAVDANGQLSVTVAGVPAGADARVDYVTAAAAPPVADRRWNHIGRRVGNGVIVSPRVPGGNSYVRVRAEQIGRRPSAYSANTNIAIPPTYAVVNPVLLLNDNGTATLVWTPVATVAGIRLYYQILAPGVAPAAPLPFVADVDGSLGTFTLPFIPAGYNLYLDVEGWSGFAAGAVVGTQGIRDHLAALPRTLDQTIPAIDVNMTVSDNDSVTYVVTSADPNVQLYYAFGDDPFPANPNLLLNTPLVVARATNDSPSRLLRIKAVNATGGSSITPIIVDWDIIPGLYVASDRMPLYSGSVQVGWRLRGTVDDDTRSLMVALAGGLLIGSVTPLGTLAAGVYWSDVSVTKNWTIDLLQGPGELGTVTLTPREFYNTAAGGMSGPAVDIKLERPAVITHVIKEITTTRRDVTLSVTPSTAKIEYRVDGGVWFERTGGSTTFSVDVGGAAKVIEYYSVSATGTISDVTRLVIDQDPRPSVTSFILTESANNVLTLALGLDDDVTLYRVWARRGAWPTVDGLVGGIPDDQFMRYNGTTERTTIDWRASGVNDATSDWFVIARAYDDAGDYDQYPDATIPAEVTAATKRVSGAPAAAGALSSLAAVFSGGFNVVDWNHNATVQGAVYTVTIRENGVQLVTGRDARLEPAGASVVNNYGGYRTAKVGANPGDPGAVFLTYNYEVDLRTPANALVATYTTSMSGWYAGGGGGGGAPAEIPNTLSTDFPNDPTVPRGHWNNTNAVASIHIQWWAASTSGGSYILDNEFDIAANSIFHDYPTPSRRWVKFRVRYYNASGDGVYSAYSTPVQLP